MSDAPIIPAVPSLGSITDTDTQRALSAIKGILEVRNGDTGSGEHAFITRGELANLVKNGFSSVTNNYSTAGGTSTGGDGTTTGTGSGGSGTAGNGQTISAIANDVMNSALFQELGKRISLIDAPGTGVISRVGRAQLGLAQESAQRINNDNVIISAINTMWGVVGNASALIQSGQTVTVNQTASDATLWRQLQASVDSASTAIREEATVRANADRSLFAQYTIKIDQNGFVAGYGLSSETTTAGATTSAFIVRADRFAVGSPSGPGVTPLVPFIVQTTPTYINGKYVAPGVYMDTATLRYGSITTAFIGTAQVDTLTIAGNAVTVPANAYTNGGAYVAAGGFVEVQAIYMNRSAAADGSPMPMAAILSYTHSNNGASFFGDAHTVTVQVVRTADGATVFWGSFSAFGAWTIPYAASFKDSYAGPTWYSMQVSVASGSATAYYRSLTLIETRR